MSETLPFEGLSRALQDGIARERSKAILIGLDPITDAPVSGMEFQYFPGEITDAKTVNYNPREVPGGSLPIYQYINSGERSISISAVFTCDTDLLSPSGDIGIMGSFGEGGFSVGRTPVERTLQIIAEGGGNFIPDIRSTLVWLRSFLVPAYSGRGDFRTTPPGKMLLNLEGTGVGLVGGDAHFTDDDTILCIMNDCGITYESFFASGLPRIVSVSLTFFQVAQRFGTVRFPSRTDKMNRYANNGSGAGKNLVFTVKNLADWMTMGED